MAGRDSLRDLVVLARRGGRNYREEQAAAAAAQMAKQPSGLRGRPLSAHGAGQGKPGTSRPSVSPMVAAGGSGVPSLRRLSVSVITPRSVTRPGSAASASTFRMSRKQEIAEDPLRDFKDKLEAIVESQLDLDWCEKPFFRTALWEATWKNHEEIVRLLAEKKASVSAADHEGRTPLHEAAYYGHCSLVEFFLDRGHPIDCVDQFGHTPLFRAVEGGRSLVVERLVEKRAATGLVDKDNVTVQHLAAFNGRPQMSEWLLYKGAFKNRISFDEAPARQLSEVAAMPRTADKFAASIVWLRRPASALGDAPRPPPPAPPPWEGRQALPMEPDSGLLKLGAARTRRGLSTTGLASDA